jgi:hypothetical protein
LLRRTDYDGALAVLDGLQRNFAGTAWAASHEVAIAALRKQTQDARDDAAAQALYAQAAARYAEGEPFELRPLVERLRADYAATGVVQDAGRKPSLAEMERAVADLGKRITVGKTGAADFRTIQGAIADAPPNSIVEILDSAIYEEHVVAAEKRGLTIRGRRGQWPVLTLKDAQTIINVLGGELSLVRLVLVPQSVKNKKTPQIVVGRSGELVRLRECIVQGGYGWPPLFDKVRTEFDQAIVAGRCSMSNATIRDGVWLGKGTELGAGAHCRFENLLAHDGRIQVKGDCEFRSCTLGDVAITDTGRKTILADCIAGRVDSVATDVQIQTCDLVRGTSGAARKGLGCFSADPLFLNLAAVDYRLSAGSPCRGKAAAGGDLGFRYTPAMIAIMREAAELRVRGLLSF